MSESLPPSEQPENTPEAGARTRVNLGRLVPRRKGARWAALGAAVVIAGGAAVAVAVAVDGHDDRRVVGGPRFAWSDSGPEGGKRGPGGRGDEHRVRKSGDGHLKDLKALKEARETGPKPRDGERGPGGPAKTLPAPAPLPSPAIGQAAEKAAAAVDGGKVESIRVIAQEGGGSAWLAVVLGPDGVRHRVTVSGTDGTVTGNTPVNAVR
ncbi:hypothetical protein [Streptomyces sp. ISL-94]|uniref:hypothetical protein n=1 Tax=Streptomyces sp. ISL-94 TaxID=2819190 RepID=UPI001BEBFEAC|nr:hypothetical protein [Streptomyces sp. ISL-94]MBT2480667.1 hypothetical protein [Streptomyces sp. ISL-94]